MTNSLLRFLILCLYLLSSSATNSKPTDSSNHADGQNSGSNSSLNQWHVLTKFNYSSQIRLHPHLLLLITVPWCGESRSLMKELAARTANESLKLMVMYRNKEKMLADAIGDTNTDGITLFYYHYGEAYRYRGRLGVQNILASVHYGMSRPQEEIPLKLLNTEEELAEFLDSADKTVVLAESCGWTQRLIASEDLNNGTRTNVASEDDPAPSFTWEANETLASEDKEKQKGDKINCGIEDGFGRTGLLSELTPVTNNDLLESDNSTLGGGDSCTFDEFKRFESFLPKFITLAREFFLPPERFKFGLISSRSLFSRLNMEEVASWSMSLHLARCPSCSQLLNESDDLVKTILQTELAPVIELEGEHDSLPALPANKPSVLLFIDRSSELLITREESKEALGAVRELAMHCQLSGRNTIKLENPPVETYQMRGRTSKHSGINKLLAALGRSGNEKMSVMVVNEGKHVNLEKFVSDFQGGSLQEILAYALNRKKDVKLSSLAKNVGFQLLSEDFNIKLSETLGGEADVQAGQVSKEVPSMSGSGATTFTESNLKPHIVGGLDKEHLGKQVSTDAELLQLSEERDSDDTSVDVSLESDNHDNEAGDKAQVEEISLPHVAAGNEQKDFRGSFYFLDGQYRLLKSLTGVSKVPSVVITDPTSQKHYVLTEKETLSYSVLSSFLDRFLNGSLPPHMQSESALFSPREAPVPPFVNLDFHEMDSIPRVTGNTFSELVLSTKPDSMKVGHASDNDVLVLFSHSWCGFCQRMELVVREVFRTIKGYGNMIKDELRSEKQSLTTDNMDIARLKLPLVYLMDCTLNDCSSILKSMVQRELYPQLMLFPAASKKAISYEGDMIVADIIKFLADHGNPFNQIFWEKGILHTEAGGGGRNESLGKEASMAKNAYEILLRERMPKVAAKYNHIRTFYQSGSNEITPLVSGGSLLVATDKLLNVHPFDESRIIIVKVDQSTGFHGLIMNKPIGWDSLDELEDGLELLKRAPLSFGGPVIKHGMPLVALSRNLHEGQYPEIIPNIYFLDQKATLNLIEELRLGNQSFHGYWFFLGFSSWGFDQLFYEIAEGAWTVSKGKTEHIDWPEVTIEDH